jgi:hypothetical protein
MGGNKSERGSPAVACFGRQNPSLRRGGDGGGVPLASGDSRGVDDVQRNTLESGLWSMQSNTSCREEEVRPKRL